MAREVTTASAFLYVQPTTLPNVFRVDYEETLIGEYLLFNEILH